MKRHAQITVLLLSLLALATGAFAQECPGFPQRGIEIIDALAAGHQALARGDDEARRMLTRMIAEQMRFELGNWSTKSADPGRPQSKDSLAQPVGDVGAFCNWDWQHGTTRQRVINAGTRGDLITDQNLLPTRAINHLGMILVIDPVPTPVPVPPTPPANTGSPLDAVILHELSVIRAAQEAIKADQDNRDSRVVHLLEESAARELALQAQLKKHDEEPTYVMRILNKPLVKYGLLAAGALVAGKFGVIGS